MNENKLARALVAQQDLNFALIGFIFKLIDASPPSFVTEDLGQAITEVVEKNTAVLAVTKQLVSLSVREDADG
jgi:hypothetical protein